MKIYIRIITALATSSALFTGNLGASDFKPPKLTDHALMLIERTKLGPLDERAEAIEECGVSRYIPCYYTLISLLKDESPLIRRMSGLSLGLLRNPNAITYIDQALATEKDESVKLYLLRSLGLFRTEKSLEMAEKFITDESEKVRFEAAKVLNHMPANAQYEKINTQIKNESSDLVKVMLISAALKVKKTSDYITELVKYFYSTKRNVRLYAARTASDLQMKETLLPLRKAIILEDDFEIRDELIQAYNDTYHK